MKIKMITKPRRQSKKHMLTLCAVSLSLMLGAGQALASKCFIMVHGHGVSSSAEAQNYWSNNNFSEYNGDNFMDDLLQSGDNYGLTYYNSSDGAGLEYWRNEAAGEIARQIATIKTGSGDGYTHAESGTQCAANDTFFVIAHSQGGPEMMYIAGNAITGSPSYNTAYNSSSNAVTVDFESAMDNVEAIFSMGGSITGTEGADRICNGSWIEYLIGELAFGGCNDSVKWQQTSDSYTVRNQIGSNLAVPYYVLGGWDAFPGIASASSLLLGGDDDGYINLASQMSCSGSATRNLYNDLKTYNHFLGIKYGSATYECSDSNKGTPRTYNAFSLEEDHDSERNGGKNSPSNKSIPNGLDCGSGNMASRISSCTAISTVTHSVNNVAFKSAHNKYLVAEGNGGGDVNANRSAIGSWEKFNLELLSSGSCITSGATIAVSTQANHYLRATSSGDLDGKASVVGSWEQLTLVNHSDGSGCLASGDSVSLKSSSNLYVVAESNGDANANRSAMGSWERFVVQF